MYMNQDNMIGMIFVAAIVFAIVLLIPSGKKADPPPEPDQKKKDEIAREVLSGVSVEEIAERDGYSPDDICQWQSEYLAYIMNLAEKFEKTQNQIDLLTEDIEWFKAACKDHIGDDWEEKTDFANRARIKYK